MNIIVVSNSTPIIELAVINELGLLNQLFNRVYITRQVYDEVCMNSVNKVGADELRQRIQLGSIILYDIIDSKFIEIMYGKLHKGELSVMVAAKELGVTYVLMDDISARKTAESFSLVPIGTAGVLKLAKVKGFIQEVKPLLDKLIDNNFRISLKLYNEILKDVNEI